MARLKKCFFGTSVLFGSVLLAALLAGCAGVKILPGGSDSVPREMPVAEPQTLTAWVSPEVFGGEALLSAYAEARGITLQTAASVEEASVCLLPTRPEPTGWRTLTEDETLRTALSVRGMNDAMQAYPLGDTAYGYLADTSMLQSLLGSDSFGGLQNASAEEWQKLVSAVTTWIAKPSQTTLTLGGVEYTLPAQKDANTLLLQTVFALPQSGAHGTAALAPALAQGEIGDKTQEKAISAAWDAFLLESENGRMTSSTAEALELLKSGGALFCRTDLSAAGAAFAADAEFVSRLALVPFKQELAEERARAVWHSAGVAAISASASPDRAGEGLGFLLWLIATDAGDAALADSVKSVTPRGTVPASPLGEAQAAWREGSLSAAGSVAKEAVLEAAYANAADGEMYAEAVFAALAEK